MGGYDKSGYGKNKRGFEEFGHDQSGEYPMDVVEHWATVVCNSRKRQVGLRATLAKREEIDEATAELLRSKNRKDDADLMFGMTDAFEAETERAKKANDETIALLGGMKTRGQGT